MQTTASTTTTRPPAPDEYDVLLAVVRARASDVLTNGARLFTTDADGLYRKYLDALPPAVRQAHVCHSCRQFIDRFGALVTISPEGRTTPLLWNAAEVPTMYAEAVAVIEREVRRAKVTGVFLSDAKVWGVPTTGAWSHFAIKPHASAVFSGDPGPVAAQKSQDHEMLHRGLAEFSAELVTKAHSLLSNGQLFRSEKHVGVAKWLIDLYAARDAARGQDARNNVVWRAVASAPPGFCHVRSGMIGTLLEDLASGMPFATLKRRFDEKMDPLQYQRATAPLSEGNRQRAEKLIAEMGVASALERRFARVDEVEALWRPKAVEAPKSGGVFGHLRTDAKPATTETVGPPVTVTWEKFARTALPTAREISFSVPFAPLPYFALVTAKHADAKPILQWDSEDRRNPVSWYFYNGGSAGSQWNLGLGARVKVNAICLKPSMWNGRHEHQGQAAFFILDGAWDTRHQRGGGFFTECLKSELHEVRATLEAYMLNATIEGAKDATACGIAVQAGQAISLVFRVVAETGVTIDYKIDRWD